MKDISIKKLKVAYNIATNGSSSCIDTNCNDCPYNDHEKGCPGWEQELFAALLKAEIKRRKTAANRKKLTFEIDVKCLDKFREAIDKFKMLQKLEEIAWN